MSVGHLQRVERVEAHQLAQAEAQRQQERRGVGVHAVKPAAAWQRRQLAAQDQLAAHAGLTRSTVAWCSAAAGWVQAVPLAHLVSKDSSSGGASATE